MRSSTPPPPGGSSYPFARRSPLKGSKRALLTTITLAVLALLYLQALELRSSAHRRMGMTLGGSNSLIVTTVDRGSPAERAGIRVDDQLLMVGNHPLDTPRAYTTAAAGFVAGQPISLVLERNGARRTVRALPGMPFQWGELLLNSLVSFAYLAVSLLAFFQPFADLRARLLGLFTLAVALEVALPSSSIGSPLISHLSLLAVILLTGFQAATELHLASLIPRRRPWLKRHPWLTSLYYWVGLGTSAVAALTYSVEVLSPGTLPWTSERVETLYDTAFLPLWAVGLVILLLPPALRWQEARGRQQAILVLLGVLPWAALMLSTTVFYLLGRPEPGWYEGAIVIALLCYPVAIFAAIFRSHLFDLELLVRRSALYTLLTTSLVLLFYGALGVGGALFSRLVEDSASVWVVGGATLLLGLAFSPLRQLLERLLRERIFPEQAALRQRLIALAEELPAKVQLPAMGHHLVREVKEIFGVGAASVLLAQPETRTLSSLATTIREPWEEGNPARLMPFDDPAVQRLIEAARPVRASSLASRSRSFARRLTLYQAHTVAPILHRQDLVGVLLLGEKVGGRSLPGDEQEMLGLLCRLVATVFENARLFEAATTDSLTGLLRREMILEKLEMELRRAERYRRPLTVGMADLDHFKEVNDRHGHLVGDILLQRMAKALKAGLRSTDWVGRYGGEEFLLVLPETELAGAAIVAEKVRRLIATEPFATEEGEEIRSTISIGLASLWESEQSHLGSANSLITAADRALYRAKTAGRNRIESRGQPLIEPILG